MQDGEVPPRADHDLTGRVLAALSRPALGLAELQVDYVEAVVVLRGRAPSVTMRVKAGEIATHVPGVAIVSNHLRVG